jgi:hypothetical protein
MRSYTYWGLLAIAGWLSSCESPGPQYRFSDEQRAWQPYHPGDVLRFGHAQDSRVRTYRIIDVDDHMEEARNVGISLGKGHPMYEEVTVRAERMDTTLYYYCGASGQPLDSMLFQTIALNMTLYNPTGGMPLLQASCGWDYSAYSRSLPLDSAIAGAQLDYLTLKILPKVTLGGIDYGQTIWQALDYGSQQSTRRYKLIRQLYYTREKGVVAFEEDGTGLWYRLP